MIKRDGYRLIGRAIASLLEASTKGQVIAAFVRELSHDRAEFDAAAFKETCGAFVAPSSPAVSTPVAPVVPRVMDDAEKERRAADRLEIEIERDSCPACGEFECTNGKCGWTDEEVRTRAAVYHKRRVAQMAQYEEERNMPEE